MRRRTLLTVGAATGVLLAVAGGTLAWITPARRDGRLTPPARRMLLAVARTVLGDMLPAEAAARERALEGHLQRIEATITGMPPAMQAEVDEMLTIAASPPGRLGLIGLTTDWPDASPEQLTAALQGMRTSSVALRLQAYHALRDMTNASWFADPTTWASIGYPGPRAL